MDDFLRSIMKDFIEEVKKDLPPEVSADLEELSALKTDVKRSMMHCRLVDMTKVKRINELTRKHYFHGKENEQTMAAAEPDTFDFGEAIRRLKKGARLARKGWNGKDQYIEIAVNIRYSSPRKNAIHAIHEDIGSAAVAFVGTRGTQIGWLASQSDMLADDWYVKD